MDAAAAVIGERTRIVAFTHVSNVLGIVNPVAELVALAQAVGAVVRARRLPVRAASAPRPARAGCRPRRLLRPQDARAVRRRRASTAAPTLLDALPPFLTGGSMITTVTLDEAEYLPPPQRFEAGTQPVSQAIGLAAAVRYLDGVGMPAVHAHEQRARGPYGRRGSRRSPASACSATRPVPSGSGSRAFDVDGVHAHDVGQFLDARGIAVRVGHHCAQPLHRRLGLTASVRASPPLYTPTTTSTLFLDGARWCPRVLRSRRMNGLESLYQELILDHSKRRTAGPRRRRRQGADHPADTAGSRRRTSATRSAATRSRSASACPSTAAPSTR